MNEIIGNGAFVIVGALLGAFVTTAMQNRLLTKQTRITQAEERRKSKQTVIAQLIAYRFVLTGRVTEPAALTAFNAALSSVPVYFAENRNCMDMYRAIGDGFTAEKFHRLIIELMKDVPLPDSVIDKHLLENVPSVNLENFRAIVTPAARSM